MRVVIDQDPFVGKDSNKRWDQQGHWPCAWVSCPDAGEPPFVTAYRLPFSIDHDATVRIHVSADERYELFLDGQRIGRGSERGAPNHWFFETYDLPLEAGQHMFVARVWSLGERAPFAQMQVHHGFLLAAEGAFVDVLGTGVAPWEAKRLPGYSFVRPQRAHWKGDTLHVDGHAYAWDFEQGLDDGWQPVQHLAPAMGRLTGFELVPTHVLKPATLPPMINQPITSGKVRVVTQPTSGDTSATPLRSADHVDEPGWSELVAGAGSITLPAHTTRRVLIDLDDYYCAYPEIVVTDGEGSSMRLHWAEALFLKPEGRDKGNRDIWEGKYFIGIGDTFVADGGTTRRFTTLWWEAGRFLELLVQTAEHPLTIEEFRLNETRYPLEMESAFAASDTRLVEIMPILVRGIQMCAHETYMDCPYYEELMYAGDTRLEVLTTYVMSRDTRLPRKALQLFDASRLPSGITLARFPSRVPQIIAPFSLWWVDIVYDFAMWRDDLPLLKWLMPGVRATTEAFQRYIGADGLLHAPEGWNTLDWVPAWIAGIPPDANMGVNGLMNWQLVHTLTLVAELETLLGESELATRTQRQARGLAERATVAFWDEERGLFADDLAHAHYSEHTQCLALLSNLVEPERVSRITQGLLNDGDLARTTYYFSHYLFETFRQLGRVDKLLERLELWFDLKTNGFRTPPEMADPNRSDCHAWSSHPLFHYFATILGIRPAGLGFHTVEIAPQLGPLSHVQGRMVHPRGDITVELRLEAGDLRGTVSLPDGVTGTLRYDGAAIELVAGKQTIALSNA